MSAIVVDASVVVKTVVTEAGSPAAVSVLASGRPLLAPENVYCECANALWKRVHRGLVEPARLAGPLSALASLPLLTIGLRDLTPAAVALALEYDHPVYDCYYLAAAIRSDCELVTADRSLFDLARRVGLGD